VIGTDEDDMKLSERRANTVKKFLEEKGVPADKMMAQGFGESKPIATNKTSEGRQQSQRVKFRLANP
jgi:OmpA-OmpF porin, OOP family